MRSPVLWIACSDFFHLRWRYFCYIFYRVCSCFCHHSACILILASLMDWEFIVLGKRTKEGLAPFFLLTRHSRDLCVWPRATTVVLFLIIPPPPFLPFPSLFLPLTCTLEKESQGGPVFCEVPRQARLFQSTCVGAPERRRAKLVCSPCSLMCLTCCFRGWRSVDMVLVTWLR